jgi:hypothetical protein
MQLVVTILKDYHDVETLLLGMVELDISGSTVIDAAGMGGVLGNLPILSGIQRMFPNASRPSHVVLTVTDELKAQKCMTYAVQKLKLSADSSAGIMFSLSIANAVGLTQPIDGPGLNL